MTNQAIPSATKQSGDAARPRVLVVDDSRVIRKAVNKVLSNEFDVLEAEDGEYGWQSLADDSEIEVLIADIEMPRLDGYSLICRVRASEDRRIRDVPIIVITGAQDELTRERAFACGATDFITKPLDGVQLLARARAHARLDATTRKLVETTSVLEETSATDALTQLNSRRFFLQRGKQDLAHAKRHHTGFSVVLVEIDDYTALNTQHGKAVCDEMQKWLAKLLVATTRTEDTIARLADGVFGVIAPMAGRVEAAVLCERVRSAVRNEPFHHSGQALPLTVSLGVATEGRDHDDSIEQLLEVADKRLTLAKASGGDRMGMIYQEEIPEPDQAVLAEPDLETALKALESGEAGKLLPYLPVLGLKLLPLLEQCDRDLHLDMAYEIEQLKAKLSALK